MKCEVCGKDFDGRKGARYCSSTCRSKARRATDNLSVAKNRGDATDKSISVANGATDIEKDATDSGVSATDKLSVTGDVTVTQGYVRAEIPCPECAAKDLLIRKLRLEVAMLEKNVPKVVEKKRDSGYRLGPVVRQPDYRRPG